MFVFERDSCLFAHRSAFAGDLPDIGTVVEAATGARPDGTPSTVAAWPGWDAECDEALFEEKGSGKADATMAPVNAAPRVLPAGGERQPRVVNAAPRVA